MRFRPTASALRGTLIAGSLALTGLAATAQTPNATYQAERARCESGASGQDLAACRREAGAAQDEARRGNLTTPAPGQQAGNATDRCSALSGGAREDCLKRSGAAADPKSTTTSSGSVQGGGIIHETVTTIPAPAR